MRKNLGIKFLSPQDHVALNSVLLPAAMARVSTQGLADAVAAIQQAGLMCEADDARLEEALILMRNRLRTHTPS